MLYYAANNSVNAFRPLGEDAIEVAALVRAVAPDAKLLILWTVVAALVFTYGHRTLAPDGTWTSTGSKPTPSLDATE
ncbi:hypothetical protein [Halobaculum limi]|uniref:hypothetical protein n=1 Tax=Halobaculum limi TaxID=3031916 RepID=UPI002405C469|nr:hypothetical protein [Halobaculum sp. YSMS11]